MVRDNQEIDAYTGPGFDQLRDFLDSSPADSPQALASLDIADKLSLVAIMERGRGIAGRLMSDRHCFPGGNFDHRTNAMFDEENRARQNANKVTALIKARQKVNSTYADAIEFLSRSVLPSFDKASEAPTSFKLSRLYGH